MGEMKVNLCGIDIDNPVIPASGTFGYGYEFAEEHFPLKEPPKNRVLGTQHRE